MIEGLTKEGLRELDRTLEASLDGPPPPPASRGTDKLMAVLGGIGGPSGFSVQRRQE